jgi:hypothetical protein
MSAVLFFGLATTRARASEGEFLYLLSGTPNEEKLPVTLYRVSAAQASAPAAVCRVADGIDCVLADHERRRLVVGYPALAPTSFAVIDMDSPSGIKTVRIPYDHKEVMPAGVYLLDLPQQGELIAVALGRTWAEPHLPYRLAAAPLDGSARATPEPPMEVLRFVRVGGAVGGGLPLDWKLQMGVRGDPLHILLADPKGWSLGLPRPPYFRTDPVTEAYWLAANNDLVSVLTGAPRALDVFVKKSSEWRRIPLAFDARRVRAFGAWITAIAEEPGWISTRVGRGGTIVRGPQDEKRILEFRDKSPGRAKRKAEPIDSGMTVDDLFDGVEAVFPGELLVYNGVSGAKMTISTGQGDSEVLLVTDDAVFYRVNDELYRAPIVHGGLGQPVRIASGGEVVQAHWAFLSSGDR